MAYVTTAVDAGKVAVEASKTVAEAAAPVIATGTLDYKKVALVAGGVVVVGVGTYFCVKALKKRKANKVVLETAVPVVDPQLDETNEAAE